MNITLEAYGDQVIAFNFFAHLQQYLSQLPGTRSNRRDKTLQEDATRFSLPRMPAVMATINKFVIGLTQQLGYANLPEARRFLTGRLLANSGVSFWALFQTLKNPLADSCQQSCNIPNCAIQLERMFYYVGRVCTVNFLGETYV